MAGKAGMENQSGSASCNQKLQRDEGDADSGLNQAHRWRLKRGGRVQNCAGRFAPGACFLHSPLVFCARIHFLEPTEKWAFFVGKQTLKSKIGLPEPRQNPFAVRSSVQKEK